MAQLIIAIQQTPNKYLLDTKMSLEELQRHLAMHKQQQALSAQQTKRAISPARAQSIKQRQMQLSAAENARAKLMSQYQEAIIEAEGDLPKAIHELLRDQRAPE